jgi:hypothetical protein
LVGVLVSLPACLPILDMLASCHILLVPTIQEWGLLVLFGVHRIPFDCLIKTCAIYLIDYTVSRGRCDHLCIYMNMLL